jgi:beta-glucosidase
MPKPGGRRSGRGRRSSAADFDDHDGVALVDATRTDGDAVTPADPAAAPATLLFRSAELSGAVRFEAEVAREDASQGEARLEVRAGERTLARIDIPVTGGPYAWTTVSDEVSSAHEGGHDLHLTLHGAFRLSSFRFDGPDGRD